jgi:3alpha(or 20beta)-hydroxysteroid dehydrogenase
MKSYRNALDLSGKTALVTGAARGLGAETARALAEVGAAVLCTDVLEDECRQTVDGITASGGQADFILQDVTDEAQWQRAVARAIERFDGLDILVNNAGIEKMALLGEYSVEDFRRILDINVTGVFLGIKHASRVMSPGGAAGRGGSIINLSSVAGLIGVASLSGYCASKGAVRLLTKATAVELAQTGTGIRVNSIHPAVVWTKMGEDFLNNFVKLGIMPDYATSESTFKAAHPIGHFGEPRDVASAVLYLASDLSKWVTGTELVVDGGFTAV